LRENIGECLKQAMKDHDKSRGEGKPAADDGEILAILAKMIKQREESAKIYADAGRKELEAEERGEIAVISAFLPRQLDEAETAAAVEKALAELEAASLRDMGKVMARLKELYNGQMDFAKAGAIVRKALQ